jgi:hypothetical protein
MTSFDSAVLGATAGLLFVAVIQLGRIADWLRFIGETLVLIERRPK